MTHYKNIIVYYFSGTGNALTAARWINENSKAAGVPCQFIAIDKSGPRHKTEKKEGDSLIGFCYPTHGFFVPWLVTKFLYRFPKLPATDVFFLNTRAGMKFLWFYLPGLSGLAQWFPILLFYFKGYRTRGSLPLDMPHSWISFFPPNTKKGTHDIIERCHRIVNKMCSHLLNGKRYYRYTVWTSLLFDISVIPVTVLYVFMGRFMLAKTLFTSLKCNTCRLCEASCPVQAITIKDDRPYWKYTCESCMRCMNICPKKSIQSWVSRISLITYFLCMALLSATSLNIYLVFFIVSILFFPIYWIVFWITSLKALNAVFTYTSLTRYWNRYIAPGIKVRDFNSDIKERLLKRTDQIKDSALTHIEK